VELKTKLRLTFVSELTLKNLRLIVDNNRIYLAYSSLVPGTVLIYGIVIRIN